MDTTDNRCILLYAGEAPPPERAADAAECMCKCVIHFVPTDVYLSIQGCPGDASYAFVSSLVDRINVAANGSRLVRTSFSVEDAEKDGKHDVVFQRHSVRCVEMAASESALRTSTVLFSAKGACTLEGGRFVFPVSMDDRHVFMPNGCGGLVVSTFSGISDYVAGREMSVTHFDCSLVQQPADDDGATQTISRNDPTSTAYISAVFRGITETVTPMHVMGWVNKGFPPALQAALDAMSEGALTVVELGTWMGVSTNMMAKAIKTRGTRHGGSVIVAVDTWLGSAEHFTTMPEHAQYLARDNGYPRLFRTFLQYTKNSGNDDIISPLPLPTQQAIFVLEHFGVTADVVYVDAAHDEDAAYADVSAYWRILRQGTGWMIGDDWAWDGVRRAVERFGAEKGLPVYNGGGVWWMRASDVAK